MHKTLGERPVLRGVSLTAKGGECYALLGPNGCGKTSLLRVLSGLLKADAGAIVLDGEEQNVTSLDWRSQVGLLSHESFCYPELTPLENLGLYASLYGIEGGEARCEVALKAVDMFKWAREPMASFSRGMSQRVALARALLHRPPIILLDEPFSGLDRKGVAILESALTDLKGQGRIILLVTHLLDRVAATADRYAFMAKGVIAAECDAKGKTLEEVSHDARPYL